MAIIKAAKGGRTLGQAIDYADKDKMLLGKDCSDDPKIAKEQMQITKEIYEKTDGRQYKHYIQSFKPGETTPEQANKIGYEWAEKNFKGYEVVIGTHKDKDHIHNHIIVNSVNFENGKKIQLDKQDLERFKNVSDEICKEHGLSTIDRTQKIDRGEVRAYDMKKYQTIAQGKSYVADMAIAVEQSMDKSKSKAEFIQSMNSQGYKVDWQDHKKNIIFHKEGQRSIRASNLAKTFSDEKFSKEGIQNELARNKEQRINHSEPVKGNDFTGEGGARQQRHTGLREISTRSIETSGNNLTNESLSNIKRELQQLEKRAGLGTQGNVHQNQKTPGQQFNNGKGNDDRSR